MGRYISLLLFIGLVWGQDCTADDGTDGVELWDECYSIENTTTLDLYANGLTGVIPPAIGNLVNLEGLYLASNQLSGEIPSEIGNLVNLIDLYLSYNQLSGEIPSEIGNLVNLIDFYLSSNQLSGEIPESICNIYPNLSYFQVTHNQLCPPYPECIEDYVGYQDTSECVECNDVIGDTNDDDQVDIRDIVLIMNFIFSDEYDYCSDLNDDGGLNILDLKIMIDIILFYY